MQILVTGGSGMFNEAAEFLGWNQNTSLEDCLRFSTEWYSRQGESKLEA